MKWQNSAHGLYVEDWLSDAFLAHTDPYLVWLDLTRYAGSALFKGRTSILPVIRQRNDGKFRTQALRIGAGVRTRDSPRAIADPKTRGRTLRFEVAPGFVSDDRRGQNANVGAGAMQMFFRKGRSAVQLFVWVRRWRAAPWARWVSRYRTQFLRVDDATRGFFRLNLRDNAAPIFLCLLAWLGEAVESWLILRLLGAPVSFVAILAFDVALSLGRQLLFVLPAGLGLQDAGYVAALALLGVPDVATVGAAFVLLKRGRELLATLVGLGWGAGALSGARSLSGPDWRPFPNVD